MDRPHYVQQPAVHLFPRPAQVLRVLRHLEPGNRNSTRIRRLPGSVQNAVREKHVHSIRFRRHVRPLGNDETAVLDQRSRVLRRDLILRRRRKCTIALHRPRTLSLFVLCAFELLRVLLDPPSSHVLQFHHPRKFLRVDAVSIMDRPARIRKRHHFPAKLVDPSRPCTEPRCRIPKPYTSCPRWNHLESQASPAQNTSRRSPSPPDE